MLFELNYINHEIEKINDVTIHFFSAIVNSASFSEELMPDWFRPVFHGSPKLQDKFKVVYDVISQMEVLAKKQLAQNIQKDLDIITLCSEIGITPIISSTDLSMCNDPLKKLFNHLYSETLQKSILLNDALGSSIDDHFTKWKESNTFVVCPFCGVENYTSSEGTNRDPYDHWLCKSKYPLSAINFKNLVPMGDKCNQTAVKGEKNVLYNEETNIRRQSFYPYFKHSGITLSLNCLTPPSVGYKGEWEVSFLSNDPADQDKVDTWLDVFNLKVRYLSWIKSSLDNWKDEFLMYVERNNIVLNTNLENVRNVLDTWRKSLLSMKIFPGVLLLEAYIEYLLYSAEDSFLLAFSNLSLTVS